MTTRMQVAAFVADEFQEQRSAAVKQAAAWMVANKRTRQADYMVKDIAAALLRQGYLYARVTSAYELGSGIKERVEAFLKDLGPEHLEVEYLIDPGLIGGIKIETPTAELDASIRMKLERLVGGLQS